ncbi:pyruvate formate-lyase activating enzyme [Alkaliphilus metalliredigens QYMF]|uniref:Pyruvate formate-lyase-activating enzyme n=1 Tax=Alkaliphilus metalliredigens (strain QYMF) TaxID=293826 RepID=A6TQA0_ALKMQ|nr:pyruvate formate-lyase-activating protein [Alkaliphilus metalliredigens]ABR48368.1 pyruvate formate-lyase activating enzyme [Alkaliphilus metalliredigens QYMF]
MSITGKIHSIETFGTVDGPGIRYIIFFQGCPLRCKYCHNRDTWDLQGGKEMTVDEVISDIKKYIPFMVSSGGGVTISGGEPTLQMEFLTALLLEIKKLNLHTAIDTSGFVHLDLMKQILPYVDLVLLDLKHIDPQKHLNLTGVSNEKILSFAQYLSDNEISIWMRHVVVPSLTDQEEDVHRLAQFATSLKTVERIDLLPYHSMGKHKWESMGLEYPLQDLRDANDIDIKKVKAIFDLYELKVIADTAA